MISYHRLRTLLFLTALLITGVLTAASRMLDVYGVNPPPPPWQPVLEEYPESAIGQRPTALPSPTPIPVPTPLPDPTGWKPAAPGVDYQEYVLPQPNRVYVARMDRAQNNLILDTALANNIVGEGRQTVSGMAAREQDALSLWGQVSPLTDTLGMRSQVVVAVNGSFFDMFSGVPTSGVIESGSYGKKFTDRTNGSGFVWTNTREPFIGACVVHRPGKQFIQHVESGEIFPFQAINTSRSEDQITLYTPQNGTTTPPHEDDPTRTVDTEIVVQLLAPFGLTENNEAVIGIVQDVRRRQRPAAILHDQLVIAAEGERGDELRATLREGDRLEIYQSITNYDAACATPTPQDWGRAYASLGGSFVFLQDGEVPVFDDLGALYWHPRTAIAYNDAYIYFIVVDGRSSASRGMSMYELGAFAQEELDAVWGIAQDGGGSSAMVINGRVVNQPSDFACHTVYLPLITVGDGRRATVSQTSLPDEAETCTGGERPVANAWMMLALQPPVWSDAFTVGDAISLQATTPLYQGPGTNYPIVFWGDADSTGTVAGDGFALNGVRAKGQHWWFVDVGYAAGWVTESALDGPYPAP